MSETHHTPTKRTRWVIRLSVLSLVVGLFVAVIGQQLYFRYYGARYDGYQINILVSPVTVVWLDPEGPAARAGLQIGDEVLRINDLPIQNIGFYEWQAPWRSEQQIIQIVRDGNTQQIVLASLSVESWRTTLSNIGNMSPLLLMLAFCLYLWSRKPYDATVLTFVGLFALVAAIVIVRTHPAWVFYVRGAAMTVVPVLMILLNVRIGFGRIPRTLNFIYLIPILFLLSGLLIMRFGDNAASLLYGRAFTLAVALGMLTALGVLAVAYRRGNALIRRRLRFILIGSGIALLFIIVTVMLPFILAGQDSFIDATALWVFLLFPFSYGVAIFHGGLWQLEQAFNRSIVHLLVLFILLGVYVLGVNLSPRLMPTDWADQPLGWGLLTLAIAITFVPLRNQMTRVVDRVLYGGWYDYRLVIDELSGRLSSTVDEAELGGLLVDRLVEIMRLHGASLWLYGNRWRQVRSVGEMPTEWTLSAEIATQLTANQPFETSDQPDVVLLVPLVRNAQLLGLLQMGRRIGADDYDENDRRMLNTLANQAAVSAENIRLVNQLQERADEVNRLYQQIVTSREAERKRLARDLHDRAIQNMIHLKHVVNIGLPDTRSVTVIENEMQTVIDDLRQITADLRPPALDVLGLASAIESLVERVSAETQLHITFTTHQAAAQNQEDVPTAVNTALFRVLQEALHNVRRHAQATHVQIELRLLAESAELIIKDDGIGLSGPMDLNSLTRDGHFGVAGMREQVELYGGQLIIRANDPVGTCIEASVPLSAHLS